jgi:hypothetical protein
VRTARKAITIAAAMLWMSVILAAQQPADLVGTWSGEATLAGEDEPNTLTLVLEMKDGKLAGHMTDQFGVVDAAAKDIVLEQGAFNFTVPVVFPQGGQGNIVFKMKVEGDLMKGVLEIPEMNAKGTWQATKQK